MLVWLTDLRLVIGSFFMLLGILVTGVGIRNIGNGQDLNVNLICGIVFLLFATGALIWGLISRRAEVLHKDS